MVTLTASVEIDAAPEKVWDLIVDVRRMGDWSPTCRGAKGDPVLATPMPGLTFRGINGNGRHRWRTTCTFVAVEPGRAIAWVVSNRGLTVSHWGYRLDELPGGGTRLTETWRDLRHSPVLRFPPLVRAITGVRDIPTAIEAQLRGTLSALREAAYQPNG